MIGSGDLGRKHCISSSIFVIIVIIKRLGVAVGLFRF